MTGGPESSLGETAVAPAPAPAPDSLLEVSIFEEFLHLEPSGQLDLAPRRFSPFVSWLITTARPSVTVELGPGDRESLLSTCHAVQRSGADCRCLAVRLPVSSAAVGSQKDAFGNVVTECAHRSGLAVTPGEEVESLAALAAGPKVDLLHLSLFDLDDMAFPDLPGWFDVLAPGATVVVTSTAADLSANFAKAKQLVSDRYPSLSLPLGLTTEALVAQVPVEGAVPMVERLRNVPARVLAIVAGLMERQHAELEALRSALRAYEDLTTRLTVDVADARAELAAQVEAARAEREHVVKEFLDRLDVLSAKISTSAARYTAQLEDKDRLLQEQEQRVLAYAGRAATAQSVIDDIYTSSSWRLTAPLRLVSKIMGRRAEPRET